MAARKRMMHSTARGVRGGSFRAAERRALECGGCRRLLTVTQQLAIF
jgi:hypothetical protein